MNKRLFVATSFSSHVDYQTGKVNADFRNSLEHILLSLRTELDCTVFCAIEHEGWVMGSATPDKGVKEDLSEIENADVVLALLQDGPSAGVQYEIGYADGKGKDIIAATEIGTELAYFNQGAALLGRIKHIDYRDSKDLVTQIKNLILQS